MNTTQILKEIISRQESSSLEFKTALDLNNISKTICGFLNTSGGQVIIGVNDNHEIVGEFTENDLNKLTIALTRSIIPEAPITTSLEKIDNKSIISIEVVAGSKQPYIYNGSIYYRAEDRTTKATSKEIAELIHSRQKSETHWERQIALGVKITDLDEVQIQKTINTINNSGRNVNSITDQIDFLSYYGLMRNGDLTNASVVLFAKYPTRHLPQCRVRLVVFANSKTDSSFTTDELLENNLFRDIEVLEKFLESRIGVSSEFSSKHWHRIDRPQFPIFAVREGIMNALIHRDYSNISGSVSINYYPDRLEISNTGELPKEISISDLKKGHLSLPRNPDIAQICFLQGFIEKLGRGTVKIIEECQKAGLKEPKWISKSGSTTLIFSTKSNFSETRNIEFDQLNERQLQIINTILPGESITIIDYLHYIKTSLTDRSARNDLSLVVEGGWFIKQGSGRNTRYFRTNRVGYERS